MWLIPSLFTFPLLPFLICCIGVSFLVCKLLLCTIYLKIKKNKFVLTALSLLQVQNVSVIHQCKDQVAETMVSCCSTFSLSTPNPEVFCRYCWCYFWVVSINHMDYYYHKGPAGFVLLTGLSASFCFLELKTHRDSWCLNLEDWSHVKRQSIRWSTTLIQI